MAQNKIKQLLAERGMTPYALAQQSGLSLNQVYALVNADEIPDRTTWHTLKKIRDTLELDCVDQLESTK